MEHKDADNHSKAAPGPLEQRAKWQGHEQKRSQQGVEWPSGGCGRLQSAWLVNKVCIGAGHTTSLKWLLGLEIREVSRVRPAVDDEISSEDEAAEKKSVSTIFGRPTGR